MQTSPRITPEQIRAIVAQHEGIRRRRRYLKVRTICRAIFWALVGAAALWVAAKTGALDDYEATCDALGQVCPAP